MNSQPDELKEDINGGREYYLHGIIDSYGAVMRYISSVKTPEIPEEILKKFTKSYSDLRSNIQNLNSINDESQASIIYNLDNVLRIVYPVTVESLKISEIMSEGNDENKKRIIIKRIIRKWKTGTVLFLVSSVIVILIRICAVENFNVPKEFTSTIFIYIAAMLFGCLGSCSYILRGILQKINEKTYVIVEEATYSVRVILGSVLGLMIPRLIQYGNTSVDFSTPSDSLQFSFFMEVGVPFLAGYAVEPMFAALDNIVLTLKAAVGKSGETSKGKV